MDVGTLARDVPGSPRDDAGLARARLAACLVYAITQCVYLTTAGGSFTTSDAVVTYDLTRQLVEKRSIALSENVNGASSIAGRDGRAYSPFGLGQSIYNVPFYLAGRTIEGRMGKLGRNGSVTRATVALGSTVAAAAGVAVAFLFAWRLSGSMDASIVTAFALAFGTVLWPYSKFGFNAPLVTVLLLLATYLTWLGLTTRHPRTVLAAGLSMALTTLTRHELMLAVVPLGVWVFAAAAPSFESRLRRLATFVMFPAAAAGVWLLYNLLRFGNPLNAGQLGGGTIEFGPIIAGLHGLVLSPGRSVLLYSPIVALGVVALVRLRREYPSLTAVLAAQIVLLLGFYAMLDNWAAGRSYGSRYLLPILPFLIVPLAPWLRDASAATKRAIVAVMVLSAVVQLPGVMVDYAKVGLDFAGAHPEVSADDRLFHLSTSPLALNLRATLAAVPANVRYVAGVSTPPAVADAKDADRDFSQRLAFSLDFWWLYLHYLGALSAPMTIAAGLILIALGILLAWALWRLARQAPRRPSPGAVMAAPSGW